MKFYRVSLSCEGGNSGGFVWGTNRAHVAAQRAWAMRNDPEEYKRTGTPEIEVVEIEPTKAGILAALRQYAAHPDNG